MTDQDKIELYLSGYMQALVGKEFTKQNYEVVFSYIDMILHKQNLDDINRLDFD